MTPVMFADQHTVGGYAKGEVVSALQKEIRRGNERAAIFWATELDLSGHGLHAWKRLRVIASEDVGIAEPHLPATIGALYATWLEFRKAEKDRPVASQNCMLQLVHAVILLARAPKSRIVDNACNVFYAGDRAEMAMEIPDYALDGHTTRGRKLGRNDANHYDESYLLVGCELDDPYEAEARAIDGAAAPKKDRVSRRRQLMAALHCAYGELSERLDADGRTWALARATEAFGRPVTSSAELSNDEASALLAVVRQELKAAAR